MVGCCAHIASVLLYLGFDVIKQPKKKKKKKTTAEAYAIYMDSLQLKNGNPSDIYLMKAIKIADTKGYY